MEKDKLKEIKKALEKALEIIDAELKEEEGEEVKGEMRVIKRRI